MGNVVTITNPVNDAHTAQISPVNHRVQVKIDDTVLADSVGVMSVAEESPRGAYPAALYFFLADVSDQIKAIYDKSTHCPLKGDASYYSFEGEEIAWRYDRPLTSAAVLADYVAFYANKVTFVEG